MSQGNSEVAVLLRFYDLELWAVQQLLRCAVYRQEYYKKILAQRS